MKRSCRLVPQRTGAPFCGSRQNQASSARTSNCWARLMRASGGISNERNSTRPSRPGRAVGRIELVDADFGAMGVAGDVGQQIAEQPVDQPQRRGDARRRGLRKRDLELIELVVARFVDPRRLAGRADEQTGEQIRERRMALPIEHEAREQIGPAQERRVGRRRAADHDMVAAAGAGVAPVGQELVGAEPRQPRLLIERGRRRHGLAPGRGGMHVDLDHAGIGRHLDHVDARIVRRRVALDAHGLTAVARDRLDRAEQFEIILEAGRRRHEDAEHAVAQLDRERGAHRALGGELFVQLLRIDAGRGSVVDLAKLDRRRQRATRLQRVLLVQEGEILRLHIGQGLHRQPQADRRVAGNQEELAAPQRPALAAPGAASPRRSSAGPAARSRSDATGRDRTCAPCARALRGRRSWDRAGRR